MGVLDFLVGGEKRISVKNCRRDETDPRVTRCQVSIQEDRGIVRSGEIDVIGDNRNVFPLAKSGGLTDQDFSDTINFLKRGGWQVIVPKLRAGEAENG